MQYYAWASVIEESSSDVYLGTGFAVIGILFVVLQAVEGSSSVNVIMFSALIVSLLYGVWRWRRGRRNRAAFCDEGVLQYSWKDAAGDFYPWDVVGGAVIGGSYAVLIKDSNGVTMRRLPLEFFGSRKRADLFVVTIHDRLRRDGPRPPWVSTDMPEERTE